MSLQLLWNEKEQRKEWVDLSYLLGKTDQRDQEDGKPYNTALWTWKFGNEYLADIDITSDKWTMFKAWLENEEAQTLTQYPPDQLVKMRELVGLKEGNK